jgi:hypothetical protein
MAIWNGLRYISLNTRGRTTALYDFLNHDGWSDFEKGVNQAKHAPVRLLVIADKVLDGRYDPGLFDGFDVGSCHHAVEMRILGAERQLFPQDREGSPGLTSLNDSKPRPPTGLRCVLTVGASSTCALQQCGGEHSLPHLQTTTGAPFNFALLRQCSSYLGNQSQVPARCHSGGTWET